MIGMIPRYIMRISLRNPQTTEPAIHGARLIGNRDLLQSLKVLDRVNEWRWATLLLNLTYFAHCKVAVWLSDRQGPIETELGNPSVYVEGAQCCSGSNQESRHAQELNNSHLRKLLCGIVHLPLWSLPSQVPGMLQIKALDIILGPKVKSNSI